MGGFFRGMVLGLGTLAVPIGLLWMAQGLGLLMWPRASFMLQDRHWALYGALLAAAGIAAIWLLRDKPRRELRRSRRRGRRE